MLTWNEPQIWTIIGVFASALFGMLGFLMTSFTRAIKTELSSLRSEMNVRFDALTGRLEHIDRDVQFLMKREFGETQP